MKYYSFIKINILAMSALTGSIVANAQKSNATYSIGKDNVIQGKYFAKAKNDYLYLLVLLYSDWRLLLTLMDC